MQEQTTAEIAPRPLSSGELCLSPCILDQLDAQCVPNELLQTQELIETKALAPGLATLGCTEGPVLLGHPLCLRVTADRRPRYSWNPWTADRALCW